MLLGKSLNHKKMTQIKERDAKTAEDKKEGHQY